MEKAAYYAHAARQISRVASVDGVHLIFLLQPILVLSHKPFTDVEKRMFDYDRTSGGALYAYLFPEVYHKFAANMSEAGAAEGFTFLNMENGFDSTAEQTFTDFAHLSPKGNEVIAERLVPLIQARFGHSGN